MTREDVGWALGAAFGALAAALLVPVWVPLSLREAWRRRGR